MKMKKMIYLAFVLLFLSATSMNAQVAIGSTSDPRPGAILDLGQVTGKNLGLLLPQVTLSSTSDKNAIAGNDPADGLLVYNPGTAGLSTGIYVWHDNSWNKLTATPSFTCGSKLTDIEGNTYYTGDFGVAGCWMTENLRTTQYADGSTIAEKSGSDSSSDTKAWTYPNNAAENKTTLGLLYTWAAASNRTGIDYDEGNNSTLAHVKGVCPAGWHLPSDYEWSQLEEVIAKDAANKYSSIGVTAWDDSYYSSTGYRGQHGQKMKSQISVNGQASNGASNAGADGGFDFMLAGRILPDHTISNPGFGGYMWSGSSYTGTSGWGRYVFQSQTGMTRSTYNKGQYQAVRCKQN